MNAWVRFKLSVKRRETPFHSRLHDMAKSVTVGDYCIAGEKHGQPHGEAR